MNEPLDDGLAGVAALLREHAHAPVPPELDRAGKLALERRLQRATPERTRRARPWLLAAAALAAGLVLGFLALRPRPLQYEVRGAPSDGPYIGAPASAPVTVAFSDGSSLEAGPGSRLRVDEARVAGARVLLERGTARVHVEHHATSAWNFVAGPFDVHVTGTRFELSWDPSGEALDLRLVEGSVEVRGPFAEAPIAARAGQRFRADLASRSMTVIDSREHATSATPPPSALPTATAAGEAAPEPPASGTAPSNDETRAPARSDGTTTGELDRAPGHADRSHAATAPSAESWSELVARGQFETVVAKAAERGESTCENACSAVDLRALADAARYTGRRGLAESALLSLRRRFGDSHEGRSAAFLLGRLAEARGATANAERWYDTYLRELPAGDLAAEALAGKMRMVFASEGRAAAAPLATQYLARYPNGVHAQTARGILGQEPSR